MKNILTDLTQRLDVSAFTYGGNLYLYGNTKTLESSLIERLRAEKATAINLLSGSQVSLEMNFCQRSMVLDELFNGNLSGNSIFILLHPTHNLVLADMEAVASVLYARYPILHSRVVVNADGFFFDLCEHERLAGAYFDDIFYYSINEFANKYSYLERSLFEPGLMKIIGAKVDGCMQWGIWLHHIAMDMAFLNDFLALTYRTIEGQTQHVEPDFAFLQQNWHIKQIVRDLKAEAQAFWSGMRFGLTDSLLLENHLSITKDVTEYVWDIPSEFADILKNSLSKSQTSLVAVFSTALESALSVILPDRTLLALTTFTLRTSTDQTVCSGFYTNLLPFQLSTFDTSLQLHGRLQEFNQILRSMFEYGWLPYEEICELTEIKKDSIIAIINLVRVAEKAAWPKDYFTSAVSNIPRNPLKLTILENERRVFKVTLSGTLARDVIEILGKRLRNAILKTYQESAIES